MARVVLARGGNRREFFVVDEPVGPGLKNAPDDVALVQFFLRIASETVGDAQGFKPPGALPISIDGRFGTQTRTYIDFYQKEVNRRLGQKNLQEDGRIDPIAPGQTRGAITKSLYTILSLNVTYRTRHGDTTRIETEPLFPQALQRALFI
jgi:hypothetical protein